MIEDIARLTKSMIPHAETFIANNVRVKSVILN